MKRDRRASSEGARRRFGTRILRMLRRSSQCIPFVGAAAIVLAVVIAVVEPDPTPLDRLGDRILRTVFFVLSCFIGSYAPLAGQPEAPSSWSVLALVLALLTTMGGVALAVLTIVTRRLSVTYANSRSHVVVFGEGADAAAFAARLRDRGDVVVTVGPSDASMIRAVEPIDLEGEDRIRRTLRRAREAYVFQSSNVDGALLASAIRTRGYDCRTFQKFEWGEDHLVFRPAIRDGRFPQNEVFSLQEITAIHLARLIGHLVRTRREVLRVCFLGENPVLGILRARLEDMRETMSYRGGIEHVDDPAQAQVIVLGVGHGEYVQAVDRHRAPDRIVFSLSPERYFAAVGRTDLDAVGSAQWLAERDRAGRIAAEGRIVLVDEARIGSDIREVSMGIRGRWAREFHNAHSDFGDDLDARAECPNRWLDDALHPRLVRMAEAAVDLMLRDLHAHGYELIVRDGPHDELPDDAVDACARHVHEQYLELTWTEPDGRRRRCAEHWVDPDGVLQPAVPPPAWDDQPEHGRARNRAMVRDVYPALAAIFGYRITAKPSA